MPRVLPLRRVSEGLLLLLLVFLPWLEGGSTPSALFISHTIVFLLLGIILWGGRRSDGIVMGVGWETPAGLALVVVCVVSFLGVDYFFGPFLSLWNVILAALLALVLVMMGPVGPRGRAIAVAIVCVAQAAAALLMPAPQNMTSMGTFANANQLAAYLGIGALVTAGLALDAWRLGARLQALLFSVAAALDIAVIIRVGARGALMAVLFSGAVWIALAARNASRRVRFGLWGALLVLVVLGAAGVAARFDRVSDPYRFDRMGIWGAGLKAGMEHPILGNGPGVFEARAYRFNFPLDREMFRYSKRINSAHSTYVEVFAATGFAGIAALLVFLVLLGRRLFVLTTAQSHSNGLAAGVAFSTMACLVHGLVETPFDVPAVTWTLLALLVPLLAFSRPGSAAIHVSFRPVFWPAAAAALSVWAGGVLLPYAAHAAFLSGLHASTPGSPAGGLNDAILRNPYNPLYRMTRAQVAWRRDHPLTPATVAAADLDLEQAQRLDPGNPEPRLLRAQLHARACFEIIADPASVGRAERFYREAIALGIRDPRPHAGLALFLLAQERTGEGIELLTDALALEPRYVAARVALTRALLDAGDQAGASAEFLKLSGTLGELAGYFPKNGYEEDLMKSEPGAMADLRDRLK